VVNFCREHVYESSASTFSEICSLLAFVQAHTNDYARPRVTWSSDLRSITFDSHTFTVAAFTKMIRGSRAWYYPP
jgi:hypothetical protein